MADLVKKGRELATGLCNATRHGSDADIPEGSRFVTLSDTLTNQLAAVLDEFSDYVEGL